VAAHIAEKEDDVAFAGKEGQVTVDDDAVEAVINPLQEWSEKIKKELHRRWA
jgi:predicted nucleotidyltransferase